MTAGLTLLKILDRDRADIYPKLDALTARLGAGVKVGGGRGGSFAHHQPPGFHVHLVFREWPINDDASARTCDTTRFGAFFRGMLERASISPPASSKPGSCPPPTPRPTWTPPSMPRKRHWKK